MKNYVLITIAATVLTGCSSVKIKHVGSYETLKNEYYYVLPKTAFAFEVPVQTTSIKVGGDFNDVKDMDKYSLDYCVQKLGLDKDIFLKLKKGESIDPTAKVSALTFFFCGKA